MSVQEEDYDELIYHVPKQKKPPTTNMGASVSVFPPLGQVTQVQKETIRISALLQVPADQAERSPSWEVALWHSTGDDTWTETLLSPAANNRTPSTLQHVDSSVSRLWFEGQLSIQELLHFTVKFRSGPDQDWRWARDEQGMGDGTIIVNRISTTDALPDDFSMILKGCDQKAKVKSCQSQCPGTRLWSLEVAADAVKGDDSALTDVDLGIPFGGFLR